MLTIGYDPEFAPISFAGDSGRADGRAVRQLRSACETARLQCRFVPVALPDQEAFLADGKIDLIAVLAVTPQRLARFELSQPFLGTGAAWFAPGSIGAGPFDPDIATANIATPANGPLVRVVAERWPHLGIIAARDYRDALQRVIDGEASAAALNFDAGKHRCEELFPGRFALPQRPFFDIPLAVACARGRRSGEIERLFGAIETH